MRGRPVCLRGMTAEEASAVEGLARSRTAAARRGERARMVQRARQGETPPSIAEALGVECRDGAPARSAVRRRRAGGLRGPPPLWAPGDLLGRRGGGGRRHRTGQPAPPGPAVRVVDPDRLAASCSEQKGIAMRRSRINEICSGRVCAGAAGTWFGERVDPSSRRKGAGRDALHRTARGRRSRLPERDRPRQAARSYPGRGAWFGHNRRPRAHPAGDGLGRRGKGYVSAPSVPATAPPSQPYPGRGTADWVASWSEVEGWLPQGVERVYAIADNLSGNRATDMMLFMLGAPALEIVFHPSTPPTWTSSSHGGRCCARSPSPGAASGPGTRSPRPSTEATAYWNAHRRPFLWGQRRRRRPRRQPGIALLPKAT